MSRTLHDLILEYQRAIDSQKAVEEMEIEAVHDFRNARDALVAAMQQTGTPIVLSGGNAVSLILGGMGGVRIEPCPYAISIEIEVPDKSVDDLKAEFRRAALTDEPDDAEVAEQVAGLRAEFLNALRELGIDDALTAYSMAAEAVADEGPMPWDGFSPPAEDENGGDL